MARRAVRGVLPAAVTLAIVLLAGCRETPATRQGSGSPGVAGKAAAASPVAAALGAHGLRLPATFRGDLPCADCEAIRYHLDLWPDRVFHLRREWVGKDLTRDDMGRWRVDPERRALVLHGGAEMPLQFEVQGTDKLRALDLQGKPIESRLPYGLVSDGTLAPTDLALTFGGEMTYMADAARLTECLTGRSYPIAMEGEYVKLERAYREAVAQPGAPLCVTFEGALTDRPRMEGEGVDRALVVRRFIGVWPEERCERARADAALTNTYWRIVRLGGAPVEPAEGRREPHLLLMADGERPGYSATVGCNQMVGSYTVAGDALAFRPGATTLMACPPPLDALERSLGEALSRTARWRLKGNTLEFTDADGAATARFEAVDF